MFYISNHFSGFYLGVSELPNIRPVKTSQCMEVLKDDRLYSLKNLKRLHLQTWELCAFAVLWFVPDSIRPRFKKLRRIQDETEQIKIHIIAVKHQRQTSTEVMRFVWKREKRKVLKCFTGKMRNSAARASAKLLLFLFHQFFIRQRGHETKNTFLLS